MEDGSSETEEKRPASGLACVGCAKCHAPWGKEVMCVGHTYI